MKNMNKFEEVHPLTRVAMELELENREILRKYSARELATIYNGIGPDAFPEWLRKTISSLHPSLAVVAFIHDVEWHESDKSRMGFTASNDRFKRNGYTVAKANYGWYNPLRYIVMNNARRFGNLCQLFGWPAWCAKCKCGVNQKTEVKK